MQWSAIMASQQAQKTHHYPTRNCYVPSTMIPLTQTIQQHGNSTSASQRLILHEIPLIHPNARPSKSQSLPKAPPWASTLTLTKTTFSQSSVGSSKTLKYDQVPLKFHFYKSWIIQAENEQPIIAHGFKEAIYALQRTTPQKIALTFCQIEDPVRFPNQTYRAYFDSCTSLKYSHMITVPTEPKAHNSIYK